MVQGSTPKSPAVVLIADVAQSGGDWTVHVLNRKTRLASWPSATEPDWKVKCLTTLQIRQTMNQQALFDGESGDDDDDDGFGHWKFCT